MKEEITSVAQGTSQRLNCEREMIFFYKVEGGSKVSKESRHHWVKFNK